MKRAPIHAVNLILVLVVFAGISSAQLIGTPQFNSYGGGPFDVVNLGNLNVHFTIPVLHKAGRGLPFAQDLTFDNSIWTVGTTNGVTTWQLAPGHGWQGLGATGGGLTYSSQVYGPFPCDPAHGDYTNIYFTIYSNWVYIDPYGTNHSFGTSINNGSGPQPGCINWFGPPVAGSGTSADGYTLQVYQTNGTVITPSGETINGPGSGLPSFTDVNGNQITTGGGGTVIDTLGQAVLTKSGVAPNPITFSYDAPSNSQPCSGLTKPCVKVTYVSYTVKTNFACSGVVDPTLSSVPLVDRVTLADGSYYAFTYEPTPGGSGQVTGRLHQITLPTGGTIVYTYDPSTDGHNGIICSDGSTDGITRTVNGGLWKYTRTLDPAMSSHWTTKVTSPALDDTVIDFQNGGNFYEVNRQSYQGSSTGGTLLLTTSTCWNTNTSNCTLTAVSSPITATAATLQYPGSGGLQSKTVTDYSPFNLVQEVDQYAYGSGAPGSLARKTVIAYNYSLGNILDHPSSVTVTDGGGSLLSKTTYAYDESAYPPVSSIGTTQHTSVTGSRGNATTITSYINGTATLSRHFQYYDTGTVYKAYDVNGAITTYNYPDATSTCDNAFPTGYTLPVTGLSSLASTTWNCVGAVATQVKDLNGNSSSSSYTDPYFWRPASVTDPTTASTSFTYTPTTVDSRMVFNGSNSVVESLTTSGNYGQPLYSQQRVGPSSTNYNSTQVITDSFLRAYQSTMPCVTTSGTGCSSAAKTTSTFDALGRVLQITDGGGGYVSLTYNQNDTLQVTGPAPSGENTKQKQLEYDALGRLTSVCEKTNLAGYGVCAQLTSSPNGYWTKYAYDTTTINSVVYTRLTVTQNAQAASGSQQTRTYLRDLLGRLVSETNAENGQTQYFFDVAPSTPGVACPGTYNGDLVKRYDANGNTTCYTYDALHRVTSVSYSGTDAGRTPTKTFIYDSATYNSTAMSNAKGQVAEAYTGPSGTKVTDEFFSYSVRGEVTDVYEYTPHSGSTYYHVTAGYWANGVLNTLSSNISGVPTQTYGLDAMGRTYSVTAGSGQNPVTSTIYDLANFKTTVTYGSSDSDVVNLDSNTGRMTKYTFNVGSNSDVGTTAWNANGSLASLAISDTVTGSADTQTCSYAHDDLARIASVNCLNGSTNKWNQNFTFDAFGNITKTTSGPGIAFQPTYSATSNWITALSGASPATDSNGRMTNDGVHTYSWDAENKMYQVDTTTVTNDALGRMVEKAVGSTYTQIVYSPLGKKFAVMNGQTLQKAFVPLPLGAKAVYTSTGLTYYRHHDHLGSSRLATTPSRTLYSSTAHAPYGEPYTQAGTTDLSFTGQDQDTVSGMHDFRDRRYMPTQGRWLVPDTTGLAAVDTANPQSWNRYAYVNNNPLARIDPFGDDDDYGCYDLEDLENGYCAAPMKYDATYASFKDGVPYDPFHPPGAQSGGVANKPSENWDTPDSTGNGLAGDYLGGSYKAYVAWADAVWKYWGTSGQYTVTLKGLVNRDGSPVGKKSIVLTYTLSRDADGNPIWTDQNGSQMSADDKLPEFDIPTWDSEEFKPEFLGSGGIEDQAPDWTNGLDNCTEVGAAIPAYVQQTGSTQIPGDLLSAVTNCAVHPAH